MALVAKRVLFCVLGELGFVESLAVGVELIAVLLCGWAAVGVLDGYHGALGVLFVGPELCGRAGAGSALAKALALFGVVVGLLRLPGAFARELF